MKNKKVKNNLGQTSAEYFLIAVVILAAIFSSQFLSKSHDAIDNFFVKATNTMTNSTTAPDPIADTCADIEAEYDSLDQEITDLLDQAATAEETADSSEDSIPDIQAAIATSRSWGDYHTATANSWGSQAAYEETEAFNNRSEVARINADELPPRYASYESYNCVSYEPYSDYTPPGEGEPCSTPCICYNLHIEIEYWEGQRDSLTADAAIHDTTAAGYRANEASELATAKKYYDAADEAEAQIPILQDTAADLRTSAVSLEEQAATKTAERDQLKTDNPDCFS